MSKLGDLLGPDAAARGPEMPKLSSSASKKDKKTRADAEFKKFGRGVMHSGSKSGPIVTNPKQAQAIALSESGQSRKGSRAKKRSGKRT